MFNRPGPWVVLGILCLLLPLLVLWLPGTYGPVVLLNMVLGILISRHFTALRDLLRAAFKPQATSPAGNAERS